MRAIGEEVRSKVKRMMKGRQEIHLDLTNGLKRYSIMFRNYASSIVIAGLLFVQTAAIAAQKAVISELKITILSTMLTEFRGVGEWGFAALIEADGHSILFDTGARPDTVLKNAEELGIDLSTINTVVISHNHWDHIGGLVSLRHNLKAKNPSAVQYAHVGDGIFLTRHLDHEALSSIPPMPKEYLVSALDVRDAYEAQKGHFIVHEKPHELHPGIWITGPIPRIHEERNWTSFMKIQGNDSEEEDTIPEDQALVINTSDGLIVVAGCGHAGIVNTMEYARSINEEKTINTVLGGFHLMTATDEHLEWTGTKMRTFGVEHILGAHCTGINAVTLLREAGNYDRETAIVGAVGSIFTLDEGIQRGLLNR
jgi:7,8-dihydropterin-6-yl-methyl-4-(beta-D-ribofuranosyl)aminobenzene 5'-phosphate synthase